MILLHSNYFIFKKGKNYLYALDSFHATVTGNEMERALQNVCHGTSEHSVVTFSNQKKFKVQKNIFYFEKVIFQVIKLFFILGRSWKS